MDRPRAGKHYPRSVGEFQAWFRSDGDCLDCLEWLRWPAGFSCQTARAMLHLLRSVLVRPGRDRLAGVVEVDETHARVHPFAVEGEQAEAYSKPMQKKASHVATAAACQFRPP